MPNFRDLAIVTGKSVILDEDLLDIYDYDTTPVPDWEPSVELKPFENLTKVYLDIETTGLDKKTDSIVLIGLMNERGVSHIIDCKSDGEYSGLLQLIQILNRKKPEILATFNGFNFDLPFIIHKLDHYRIAHDFYINLDKEKVFRTAQQFSQPTIYHDIWLNRGETAIIDLYHQSLAWDFVNHKLTRFGLKYLPNQLNLPGYQDNSPIELSYQEMLEAIEDWGNGGKEKLCEYLQSDLKATKAIGDFLLPEIYYQKILLPDWNMQSLATCGNGSKWNDILKQYYASQGITPPQTSPKLSYVGGLTGSKAGLYRNVSKIDVASLYPSIMLLYGIHGVKDHHRYCLSVLRYLKTERLRLKKLAGEKAGTPEGLQAKQAQGALKVMINSCYGALTTGFIEYNDFVAGAAVTAYGRAILKKMMSSLEEAGATNCCFSGDTEIMTDKGDFKIIDILNQPVKVLNINGDWASTVFRHYGKAKLWNVTVKRNREIVTYRATANHRWYVREKDGRINVYTTDKLKPANKERGSGAKLPHIMPVNPDMNFEFHRDKFQPSDSNPDWRVISVTETDVVEDVYCCVEPITNTFVLSTGCITGNSYDTDGCYMSSVSHEKNKKAWQYCQSQMPKTIELEYELEALAMYNPPTADADSDEGLRKNYILIVKDKKSGEIKVKCKGKYVKRDRCVLEKTFIPELVKRYLDGSHEAYYKQILCDLMVGTYPVENLALKRKIKANEKKLVEQGIGNCGDVVTIWKASDKILYGKRGQPLKNGEPQWTKDPEQIDRAYYIKMVKDMWEEFSNCPKY